MSAPVSTSGFAVTRIVRAPLAAAARIAASVAAVPASWEIAIRTPPCCGSSEASNASRAVAPSIRCAPAIAACSLVPQPTIVIGPPSRIDSAASSAADDAMIGATSPGSALIISSMAHGGPSRSSGMSLMAGHGTVPVARPTGPLRRR